MELVVAGMGRGKIAKLLGTTTEPIRVLLSRVGTLESAARLKEAIVASLARRGELEQAEKAAANLVDHPAWSSETFLELARAYVDRGELLKAVQMAKRLGILGQRLPILADLAVRTQVLPGPAQREALVGALLLGP